MEKKNVIRLAATVGSVEETESRRELNRNLKIGSDGKYRLLNVHRLVT